MRELIVFNSVSLDGYFVDSFGDMRWAHKQDDEWNSFVRENASGGGDLLFGRITYQLMAGYWPTPLALQTNPVVAEGMNNARKVVFSKTLGEPTWNNTMLVKDDIAAAVRSLKQQPGNGMTILGSGTIVSQLAQENLIDEFHIVFHPIVLGKGRTMFEGVDPKRNFHLTRSRTFSNGSVYLCYQPIV